MPFCKMRLDCKDFDNTPGSCTATDDYGCFNQTEVAETKLILVELNALLSSLHEEFIKFDTLDEAYTEWTPSTISVVFEDYGEYSMAKELRNDAVASRKKCKQLSIKILEVLGR